MAPKVLCTLGMFIIDQFEFRDASGQLTGRTQPEAIGGGGTYSVIGARIWLPATDLGMIVDRGNDFPLAIQQQLSSFGNEMWLYRDRTDGNPTLRAINLYRGENNRGFAYLTSKIRIEPDQFIGTQLARPKYLHFVCAPARAAVVLAQVEEEEGWKPITVYEPIPSSCTPEELPMLRPILHKIDILSPNADEAFSLLAIPEPVTKAKVEMAASALLDGVKKAVVIRSGAMGSYTLAVGADRGHWTPAFWTENEAASKVVDVTGAGNMFLGGLVAGLEKTSGDIIEASLYASVSASFAIEQAGLPSIAKPVVEGGPELWNGDDPHARLEIMRTRTVRP
ncbi:hypothetical protein FRB94_003628 [Tulasnella sp. JGI-2019a]|nr:hypothetical protein FRB94_003628 [Tulasnella sp. JGI-2019a]KAG9008900.1 hypothetical protein FRB93_005950 [Tulasnella sp. JGI-2019a]KAG9038222.1 hypothetical protein FRB95_002183 [Tulasnella sp. JGI-2019a]